MSALASPVREAGYSPAIQRYHEEPVVQLMTRLNAGEQGLSSAEAGQRLQTHGPNLIAKGRKEGPLELLWRQINNPLVWVLVGAAALAAVMGKFTDGVVVLGVVVLNAIIGFIQEYRAGKAIEALSQMVPENTTVIRDGKRITVPAADIVPGDLVVLASGDKVPADMRLINARTLRVEEAALTGESVPVEKDAADLSGDLPLGDRRNMAFGGTLVTYGTGTGLVVATGSQTEIGKISAMLDSAQSLQTPLMKSIAKVSGYLTAAIVLVALGLLALSMLRGYGAVDAILAAITLAVAAIPEGLPAIITIALAIGVRRMARRRAVVRHLPAVETLGSTTVICSDKTGTLTRNEMTVQRLWTGNGETSVSGIGYAPEGVFSPAVGESARELLRAGALCNDANLTQENGRWTIHGDPTEGALVVAAEKAHMDVRALRTELPRRDAIPFESERQYMATLHAGKDGNFILVKGAPEVVMRRCADVDTAKVLGEAERLSAQGMRVLAFATKAAGTSTSLAEADVEHGMRFLGLQAMIDPPRQEAIDSIARCHKAGISVKMITGDHHGTATAIGKQLGILKEGEHAITGAQLQNMGDEELADTAAKASVFARVAPEHKLRLVKALQSRGQVVAMTGDGVNDAPALKQADIGVAMGITGTAVSRESARIVLTDDNFASIAAAVEEGRRVYDNLVKALAFVLPTNLGEALIILAAVAFFPIVAGTPLMPMLPVQILWINLVATVALALPLAFEAMERNVMARPPREPKEPILSGAIILRTAIVAVLMAAGATGLFVYEYNTMTAAGHDLKTAIAEAQSMAVTTVILFQVFYLLTCRSMFGSMLQVGLFTNLWIYGGIALILLLQVAFLYVPAMNGLFASAPLDADAWTKSVLVALTILPVIAVEKWIAGALRKRAAK